MYVTDRIYAAWNCLMYTIERPYANPGQHLLYYAETIDAIRNFGLEDDVFAVAPPDATAAILAGIVETTRLTELDPHSRTYIESVVADNHQNKLIHGRVRISFGDLSDDAKNPEDETIRQMAQDRSIPTDGIHKIRLSVDSPSYFAPKAIGAIFEDNGIKVTKRRTPVLTVAWVSPNIGLDPAYDDTLDALDSAIISALGRVDLGRVAIRDVLFP